MKTSSLSTRTRCVFIACAFALTTPTVFASTLTYTIQKANFDADLQRIPSGGFAGSFNNSATEVGLFAHGGSGGTNETAFQTFRTTGTTAGTARKLQVGDSFSITMFSATNPFGFAGVYFNDNNTYSAWSDYNNTERTAVVLGPSGNWIIENNGTSVDTGIGANVSVTATLTVTSSNTFNLTFNGTTYYDLVMKNAPGTAARIQSFALALQNDNSANFYVKNGSLSNTGGVTIGGSNLSLTVSGVITDGLDSAGTTTNSVNTLTKIGMGTMSLTGANSYTGLTTISVGTLNIQNNTALGTTAAGTSVSKDASLQIQGGIAVGAEALTLNGATTAFTGTDLTGALRNISGNNSMSGAITLASQAAIGSDAGTLTLSGAVANGGFRLIGVGAGNVTLGGGVTGSGDFLKQGAGTVSFTTNTSTFGGGASNVFIDQGTVSVGTGGSLGTTNGTTTGRINMGSSVNSGLNSVLDIANAGVAIANPIDVRFFTGVTGGKTIQTSNTTGTATYSGPITLHDTVTLQAATNGTVDFTGQISPGVVNVPTNPEAVNGTPGVLIGSTGNAGTVKFSNDMTYAGSTMINAGTLQIDNNTSTPTTGKLSGTSGITVNSGGTLLLSGSSSVADRINNSATMTLNANGSSTVAFNTGGLSEHGTNNNTAGIGAVTLQSSSIIDMGSGNSIIAFANSSGNTAAWGTGKTISIYNWSGTPLTGAGTDQLYFGSDATGLTAAQLLEFQFYTGAGTGAYGAGAIILADGEVVPIPEPGTWMAGGFALTALLFSQRRRMSRLLKRAA